MISSIRTSEANINKKTLMGNREEKGLLHVNLVGTALSSYTSTEGFIALLRGFFCVDLWEITSK